MRQLTSGSRNTAACRPRWMVFIALCAAVAGSGPAVHAAPAAPGDEVQASITAVNLSHESLRQVPMTFGEPFRAGDIPNGSTIVAYVDGQALPTQANIKARNPDGSVRHAVLTVLLPSLDAGASLPLSLRPAAHTTATGPDLTLRDVLDSGFDAAVELDIAGQPWHLDARKLLQSAASAHACKPYARECRTWLSGPLMSTWIVGGPVLDASGAPHPHIAAYFAIRAYGPAPVRRVRVDVIVENDWAFAPAPHNITYDATVKVGDKRVYAVDGLQHFRQTRWHKAFWWGQSDPVYARQSSAYLQASMAVPRYPDVPAPDKWLATQRSECAPMDHCDQTRHMSNVGAQAGIGPLPQWTSVYVIKPVHAAYRWMLANNDALGAYPVHYRDQATGQWLSVEARPCVTLDTPAEMATCPRAPHGDSRLPQCPKEASCKEAWWPNLAHVPAAAYVAYMVTGDWYYRTEMTIWADWELLEQNPKYRGFDAGYVKRLPLRAQGWALRTLGYAAYILPDDHPFKDHFNKVVTNNIDWYNKHYTNNPNANQLHVINNGNALSYPNGGHRGTGIATWQASFFTWSIGNLKDLGFAGADKLLDWVGMFQVGLMTNPDFCWPMASKFQLQVRDTRKSPIYTSFKQVYVKNFPELQTTSCNSPAMWRIVNAQTKGKYKYGPNEMIGYPTSPTGYPSNFQIGLAAAAGADIPNARRAWHIFATRAAQPDYSTAPQFAVIPRDAHK